MSTAPNPTPEPALDPTVALRLDDWVLPLLRCPVTRDPLTGPVEVDGELVLTTEAGVRYPVVDGVPVLLAAEARGLPADQSGEEESA